MMAFFMESVLRMQESTMLPQATSRPTTRGQLVMIQENINKVASVRVHTFFSRICHVTEPIA